MSHLLISSDILHKNKNWREVIIAAERKLKASKGLIDRQNVIGEFTFQTVLCR